MDGVLLVNKPPEITSYKVVEKIKKHFSLKKVGHGGTLDPFATGLLVILIGKATRISRFFLEDDKSYEGTMVLGQTTDTYDVKGKAISSMSAQHVSAETIKDTAKNFIGEISQTPPIFSAIKVNGRKAYEPARKDQDVQLKPRNVSVYELSIKDISIGKHPKIRFQTRVSKGTYIRSLAHDIGESLKVGAYLEELHRTASGLFKVDAAHDLSEILAWDNKKLGRKIINMCDALDFPSIEIKDESSVTKVKNGHGLSYSEFEKPIAKGRRVKIISMSGECLALHRLEDEGTKAEVVF